LSFATDPIVRKAFRTMMEGMGKEFILGETIDKALKRREKNNDDRYSYDMLGEAARTWEMAGRYKTAYLNAIEAVGKSQAHKDLSMQNRDSVSVKLSALHPQYDFAHYDSVMERLVPDLRELALRAQSLGVALTVDAEEVDRLDLSLDVMERVFKDPSLKGW